MKITTADIEYWLLRRLDYRRNIVVPRVSWGAGLHECDVLCLRPSGWADEYEIKISRADLRADKKKRHCHDSMWIRCLYFVVPEPLVEYCLETAPQRTGVIACRARICRVTGELLSVGFHDVRKPRKNDDAQKWKDEKRLHLAHLGAMRIESYQRKVRQMTAEMQALRAEVGRMREVLEREGLE